MCAAHATIMYGCAMQQIDPGTSPVQPPVAEDAVLGLLMALGRMMRQRHHEDELDYAALPLLKLLSHHGAQRLSAIAQRLGLDASTVSRQVRQLEDRGLLDRAEDPQDRRASRVALSSYGADCLARGFAARRRVLTAALAEWDDRDREALRVLASRLVVDLAAASDPPGPAASSSRTHRTAPALAPSQETTA